MNQLELPLFYSHTPFTEYDLKKSMSKGLEVPIPGSNIFRKAYPNRNRLFQVGNFQEFENKAAVTLTTPSTKFTS